MYFILHSISCHRADRLVPVALALARGKHVSPALLPNLETSMAPAVSERLSYSMQDLTNLRPRVCPCIDRRTRRRLFYFGIYVRHIPTVITNNRQSAPSKRTQQLPPSRCLTKVKLETSPKPRLSRRKRFTPSILVSNVRCLRNKTDEVDQRLRTIQPDIAVLTETWLDESIPDSSITTANYAVSRKDRNAHGGGIACLIKDAHTFVNIDHSAIPGVPDCKSELLSVFVKELQLLIVAVYHPFWNDTTKDTECIDAVVSIIDYARVSCPCDPSSLQIVLCGDFNDLRLRSDEISRITHLTSVVDAPTRGKNVLDHIFANYCCDHKSKLLPPFGRSDHATVSGSLFLR